MARRRSRAEWRGLIFEWEDSGQSLAEFAQSEGLTESTMKWWWYRLRGERRERSGLIEVVAASGNAPAVPSQPSGRLHVAVGDRIAMVFEELPSAEYLAAVVGAVGGGRP